jgi:hypothetical protein
MAGRAMDDDASIADLPWASVFDPAANVRAIGAIQARGFRAATEVVDRFIRMTERGFGASGEGAPDDQVQPADQPADQPAGPAPMPALGQVVASLQKLVARLGQSVGASATAPEPTLDLVNSAAAGEVHLETVESVPAATEVWLHNRGPEDLGKVRLRCSDLLAHDGALIDASCVRFEPDVVPLPSRSSRGVTVEVDVAQEHRPGCYRGTLLADGHAEVWLPVVLNIRPRSQ